MKKDIDLMSMYSEDKEDYYDNRQILPQDPRINNKKNVSIRIISFIFVAIVIGLIAYILYFQFNESNDFENSTYNRRRIELLSEKYVRGSIYSVDGDLLAYTDDSNRRVYPYRNVFSHVVGYADNGGSGIEGAYHTSLLSCHANFLYRASSMLSGEKLTGDNIYSTIDSRLQNICYNALGDNKGAIVAIDVSTGAVRAMVSKPDYDPNDVAVNWDYYTSGSEDVESILLNRATQGLYPPGSTFKVLSAISYIRENDSNIESYTYDCSGSITYDGHVINCYNHNSHGLLDMKQSFAKSCNSSFVNVGVTVERKNLISICESFRFNKELDIALHTNDSKFLLTEESDTYELMQTVIGQGKTLATPLNMAMVAATIANDGEMMIPYFVDHVETFKGVTINKTFSKSYGKLLTETEVEIMKGFMEEVVNSGTAKALNSLNVSVAGKTGSAEYGTKGESHSWFIGYAPVDNPEIAICVLVEGGGIASEQSVPITKNILNEYYN